MAKFEVLQSNQRFLSLICAIDTKKKSKLTKSTGKFFTSIPVNLILLFLILTALSWTVKAYQKSYDFTTRLTAASTVIALCQAIAIFLNFGINVQKNAALNQTFQTIVDEEGDLDICFSLLTPFA